MTRRNGAVNAGGRAAGSQRARPFPEVFIRLCLRYYKKQMALATELDCSTAAVSQWACGKRIPTGDSFQSLYRAFEGQGASPEELVGLLDAYRNGLAQRRLPGGAHAFALPRRPPGAAGCPCPQAEGLTPTPKSYIV